MDMAIDWKVNIMFDEDPSENKSELDLCIDEIHQLQAKNKELKKASAIAKDALKGKWNAKNKYLVVYSYVESIDRMLPAVSFKRM